MKSISKDASKPALAGATPRYAIPFPWAEKHRFFDFAASHGLGLEVACFCSGPGLNDAAERRDRMKILRAELRGWEGPLSYHGVFIDIALHSIDAEIAAVSRRRVEADLLAASEIGCAKVVFHTGFNPAIPVSRYWNEVVDGHVRWWTSALERYPAVEVCLENIYEPAPALFRQILRRADHPRLRMCFDVGHANVFSPDGPAEWIGELGRWITHMHWNDNGGDRDEHLAVGEGSVRWAELWGAMRKQDTEVTVTLELGKLASIQRSLAALARAGLWRRATIPQAA